MDIVIAKQLTELPKLKDVVRGEYSDSDPDISYRVKLLLTTGETVFIDFPPSEQVKYQDFIEWMGDKVVRDPTDCGLMFPEMME